MIFKLLIGLFMLLPLVHTAQSELAWMHPNKGQWDSRINFKIELTGGEMLIENQGFTFQFNNVHEVFHHAHEVTTSKKESLKLHAVKSKFIGSNPNAIKFSSKSSSFYRNYFLDSDPSNWQSEVHSVALVKYDDFYPGIDLEMESNDDGFKYSFIVAPKADPSLIQSVFEGADKLLLQNDGSLVIKHTFGEIHEAKPIAWSIDENGRKNAVTVKYKLQNNTLSYVFPEGYNNNHQLVIDPSLTFSSYTGSTADNWGNTATPDDSTNLFAGGIVFDAGYPITTGAYDPSYSGGTISGGSLAGFDMGISKFSADGSKYLFSTYLGGSAGNETPLSLISDPSGNLYILGTTSSFNFPMAGTPFDNSFAGGPTVATPSGLDYDGTDIVVVRMAADGKSLMSATFLGGTENDGLNVGDLSNPNDLVHNYGDNFRGEIILDASGNVLVASSTQSNDFPVLSPTQAFGGGQDAVLVKLRADLSGLIWSTFYGGTGFEAGYSIQINSSGDVYATGGTSSSGLAMSGINPSYLGNTDGFLIRMNAANAAILNGTYVGTSSYDQSFFVQIDNNDDVYVYGQSEGAMPITAGLFGTINAGQFIRKYVMDLSSVIWTTKVGGSSSNTTALSPTAFLVSNCMEIYYAGWGGNILGSDISNFPVTSDAEQGSSDGDAFYVAVLASNASALKYATFFGGTADDHVDGGTSRFDKKGNIYHAVCSSCGLSNGFVSTPGVVGSSNNSNGRCNLAAFKFELNSIKSIVVAPDYTICAPDNVTFVNNSIDGDVYFWDFGDGDTSSLKNPTHLYTTPGIYTIKLRVSDSQNCKTADSTIFDLVVGSFEAGTVDIPPTICKGTPYQFNASGGLFYQWSPSAVLDDATISNPTAIVFSNTPFSVIIGDSCGFDTLFVNLNVFNDSIVVSPDTSICVGQPAPLFITGSISQTWSPNQFINDPNSATPVVTPPATAYYYVTATTANSCVFEDSVLVDVFFDPPVGDLADSAQICITREAILVASGGASYLWSPDLFINSLTNGTVGVSPINDMYYYCDIINACGVIKDSIYVDVIIPQVNVSADELICLGDSVLLTASGAQSYVWSPIAYLNRFDVPIVQSKPEQSIEYTVMGTDAFGCVDSATVTVSLYPIHPVNAGADIIAEIGDNILLEASTDGQGSFVWTPNRFLSCATCPSTYASPNFNTVYTVRFTDVNGCITTDDVQILYKGIIYVPNTFTPDGGRLNEYFKAYGEGILSFEMLIFNRWGEVISELKSIDEFWDGTYKGQQCQDGTYTWKIVYKDISQEEIILTGHVNLLR